MTTTDSNDTLTIGQIIIVIMSGRIIRNVPIHALTNEWVFVEYNSKLISFPRQSVVEWNH